MMQIIPKSILDPNFKYTNWYKTDIRQTFERVRREQAKTLDQVANTFNAITHKGN